MNSPTHSEDEAKTYAVLTEKYFIVYPNNTSIVGQIDDPELCKSIIVTYSKAKHLLEEYKTNNGNIELWRKTPNSSDLSEGMGQFVPRLKFADADFKQEMASLVKGIDIYLAKYPTTK